MCVLTWRRVEQLQSRDEKLQKSVIIYFKTYTVALVFIVTSYVHSIFTVATYKYTTYKDSAVIIYIYIQRHNRFFIIFLRRHTFTSYRSEGFCVMWRHTLLLFLQVGVTFFITSRIKRMHSNINHISKQHIPLTMIKFRQFDIGFFKRTFVNVTCTWLVRFIEFEIWNAKIKRKKNNI